jgi:hypothetical protein
MRVIEAGMSLTDIGHELEPHDCAEAQELATVRRLVQEAIQTLKLAPLTVALPIMDSLIERDGYENGELHAPIREIGRTVAGYHDKVGLTRLMTLTSGNDAA